MLKRRVARRRQGVSYLVGMAATSWGRIARDAGPPAGRREPHRGGRVTGALP
ncbi:hypothetical protein BURMUCF1_A2190 [Burkholderia multivorans ATCC BAA-247]|nr:hypothetical protein BURMUCF1_A2190 [Burkholderia multivorans ATCC BAA-247]